MSNVKEITKEISKNKITTVFDFMKSNERLIGKALPSVITPERMVGIFTMVIKSSPALLQCTQESLVGAVIQTVQLGLQPGNIGHIYLVPFNNSKKVDGKWIKKKECQLIIGYKGYVELVNRSGKASILTAEVVYEHDAFTYELGLNPVLKHTPSSGGRGEKIGVYCIAKNLLANEKVFIYVQAEKVKKIRDEALNKIDEDKRKYSPWVKWEEGMWLKTSVRQIVKLLPLSSEDQKYLATDETIKTKIDKNMTDVPDKTEWNGKEVEDGEIVQPEPIPQGKQGQEKEASEPENSNFEKTPSECEENPDGSVKE